MTKNSEDIHWADKAAAQVIKEKGDKKKYVLASGITPSGIIHIGNFREIITTELVARALQKKGKEVRFIYSWDDYDTFRKVPVDMPKQELLKEYLRKPIVDIPDPYGKEESYARHNELEVEQQLPKLGIFPEYIYQNKKYRNGDYANQIIQALKHTREIKKILDKYRDKPLEESWLPITVFSKGDGADKVKNLRWDGKTTVHYELEDGKEEQADLKKDGNIKLLWRIDWPMRWSYEKVDFEPGGKDHSTVGGSFDTAKEIVKLFDWYAPVYIMYDFITIKGKGGKISKSAGEVVTLKECLEIYQPEVLRYLFAGSRPGSEFAISFDLDVNKIYEDYDKCERIYFGEQEPGTEKEAVQQRRIYELSQVDKIPKSMPPQVSLLHASLVMQISKTPNDAIAILQSQGKIKKKVSKDHLDYVKNRLICAKAWVEKYAPDQFRFTLQDSVKSDQLNEKEKKAFRLFAKSIKEKEFDESSMHQEFLKISQEVGLTTKEMYQSAYKVLLNKDQGPKLASIILTAGKEKIISLLEQI